MGVDDSHNLILLRQCTASCLQALFMHRVNREACELAQDAARPSLCMPSGCTVHGG